MAPLRALNLPILTRQVLQFLAANGILSVEDFLVHDIYTLAARTEHQTNSEVLKQAIAEILSFIDSQHSRWLNGAQLLENLQQTVHVLPTGCEGLDSLLGGGLLEGTLTELVGPSASGKTQICLRAASHIAYHSQAAVMYLDTCNSFSSKRIAQFLNVLAKSSIKSKDQQGNIERAMKGIFHYNVFDVYSMLDLLYQIESSMQTQGKNESSRVRLLIVDSVSSVITPILSGSNLQGHSLMISLGVVLKKLALEYSIAVLITNHIVVDKTGTSKPALGESWKSMPHVRLLLSRDPVSNICDMSLLKHTSMVCDQQASLSLNS
jgi:RAD51-like protein 3|uniref:RecA family profile 1 domain-containing protein n=1 Tax=Picea sitchensis TaxID=3332 RepID=D5ADH1_PICSI|nr:unknown [Picea sitchensis]